MPGAGIDKLHKPKRRFDPNSKGKFESKGDARKEDRLRARMLMKCADTSPDPDVARAMRKLAKRLDPSVDGVEDAMKAPNSLASSRHMRRIRRRLAGEAWRLHEKLGGSGRTFTLMPARMLYTPEELLNVDLKKLRGQLLSALNRAGLRGTKRGLLIIALHGEYHPATNQFQLHWHGYGSLEKLDVVRRLKEQPRFRSTHDPVTGAKTKPVWIRRQLLCDLPAPLTYLFQSWWPLRDRGASSLSPVPAALHAINKSAPLSPTSPRRMRIPEPAHSLWLVWMNKQRIQDMVVLVGGRVMNGRIKLHNV